MKQLTILFIMCYLNTFPMLHNALEEKDFKEIKRLIINTRHVNIDEKNDHKQTPLHIASQMNMPFIVELLLSKGASINAIDFIGNTPLHYAISNEHTEVIKILLKYKAQTNIENFSGQNALEFVKSKHNVQLIELLIEKEESHCIVS